MFSVTSPTTPTSTVKILFFHFEKAPFDSYDAEDDLNSG